MTNPESESLLDQGAAILASLDAYVNRSEDRAAYRQEHGRSLSVGHKGQLAALLAALSSLRSRLTGILTPAPDPEELRQSFERTCARLEEMT
jgi:hypothetical protein